jgi:hypothetical protein
LVAAFQRCRKDEKALARALGTLREVRHEVREEAGFLRGMRTYEASDPERKRA